MAGFKGGGTRNDDLNHNLNSGGTIYAAIFTVAPTSAGGGTEVTGGSYARIAVTKNTTNFPTASSGVITNGTIVDFGTPTADWAPVSAQAVGVAWVNTASGALGASDLVYWAPFASPVTILSGAATKIPIGGATFTEA